MKADKPEVFKLRFDAIRNAHYHMAREKWFSWWHKIVTFVIILTGTTVVSQAASSTAILGLTIAALGGAQLVFDFVGNTRSHNLLRRRYMESAALIAKQVKHNAEFIKFIEETHLLIMADEPPSYRALDAVAHNQTVDALMGEAGKEERVILKWYHRLFRHVYTFPEGKFT